MGAVLEAVPPTGSSYHFKLVPVAASANESGTSFIQYATGLVCGLATLESGRGTKVSLASDIHP